MSEREKLPVLRVGTGWIGVKVIDEIDVVLTVRGYAPVLGVEQINNKLRCLLYVSARSLAEPLERFRQENGGNFAGLCIEIRKTSSDKFSAYEVRHATSST